MAQKGAKRVKRSYKRKGKKAELPKVDAPSPAPQVAEDTATNKIGGTPGYYARSYTTEERISNELSSIRYGWARIAEIAKQEQRNTAT